MKGGGSLGCRGMWGGGKLGRTGVGRWGGGRGR